jgi:hypothetical protein
MFSNQILTALWDDLTNSYESEGYINQYECLVGRVRNRILKTGMLVQTIENGPFYLVSLVEFNRLYTQESEKLEGRPFFKHQTQRHHILPKFAGGTDAESNMIRVEYDDHCLFHFIRFKTFEFSPPLEGEEGYKRSWDWVAFVLMTGTSTEKRAANVERVRMSQAKQKREGINWYNPEKQRKLSLRPSAKRDAARRAVGLVILEAMSQANQSEGDLHLTLLCVKKGYDPIGPDSIIHIDLKYWNGTEPLYIRPQTEDELGSDSSLYSLRAYYADYHSVCISEYSEFLRKEVFPFKLVRALEKVALFYHERAEKVSLSGDEFNADKLFEKAADYWNEAIMLALKGKNE